MLTLEELQAGIVLPLDKPHRWTSFQTVNKVKAIVRHLYDLRKFKIGHAGTLDPLATGLLLVCIGKATKRIEALQQGEKTYTGTLVLGATTPCYDLERPVDHFFPYEHITLPLLQQTTQSLTGPLMQTPPIFSAVKINGQRAYELARAEDDETLVKPKPIVVHSFEITAFRPGTADTGGGTVVTTPHTSDAAIPTSHLYDSPQGIVPPHLPQADFRIHCGKGTYIRSLARDLGEAVGSGAFLSALRRERVGEYTLDKALQLDEVAAYLQNLSAEKNDNKAQ